MCIFKVFSQTSSFKEFAKTNDIPVYSSYEKGEYTSKKKNRKHDDYRISFVVSEKEWDDFPGQVTDAIDFLSKYFKDIEKLQKDYEVDDVFLDFALYSRLNEIIVNQNDHLPRELIALAGKLNLGIEMSIYTTDAFDDL
jgi:hypothetical protein